MAGARRNAFDGTTTPHSIEVVTWVTGVSPPCAESVSVGDGGSETFTISRTHCAFWLASVAHHSEQYVPGVLDAPRSKVRCAEGGEEEEGR